MTTEKEQIVNEIINNIKVIHDEDTIEGQLLKPKLIRELYKQLGDPDEKDFPNEFKYGKYWDKQRGYTTRIMMAKAKFMEADNKASTNWHIKRPSMIKVQIVEEYTRDGWSCEVQAHNVICTKYVKHPRYKDLWVMFYSSRDCNKYEYVIEVPENA